MPSPYPSPPPPPVPSPLVYGGAIVLIALGILLGTQAIDIGPPGSDPSGAWVMGLILVAAGVAVPFGFRYWQTHITSWMLRPDWVAGRVRGDSRRRAVWLLVAAVALNAVIWNMLASLYPPSSWHEIWTDDSLAGLALIGLFPAGGLALLGWSLVTLGRWRKYGRSTFVLRTNPGAIGRTLEGHVETRLREKPDRGVQVALTCVRSTQGKRSSSEVLWKDVLTVPSQALESTGDGINIPVAFHIPEHCQPSLEGDVPSRIIWVLSVEAAVPGLDFSETFEVPIFDTGAEPIGASERERWEAERDARLGMAAPDADLGDQRTFHFPPRPEPATAMLMAAGVLTSVALLVYADEMQVRLPLAFVGALLAAVLGRDLFYGISLEIEPHELVIRHRVLGLGPTHRVHPGNIRDSHVGMVRGTSGARWQVTLVSLDSTTMTAATSLSSRTEAERTARRIRRAIEAARGEPLDIRT